MNLLQRAVIRKSSTEAGFDVLEDRPDAVLCRSSHAPLVCAIWPVESGDFLIALSMLNVVEAIGDTPLVKDTLTLPEAIPSMVAVFSVTTTSSLEQFLNRAWLLSRALPNALVDRYEKSIAEISATEREATVRQRVGQNLFREGLLTLWDGRCAITGLDTPELLRASHAKPWADSSDIERLDVFNGLLLAAHWDAAFDSGLITISTSGHVVPSSTLSGAAIGVLKLSDDLCIRLQPQHEPYLVWHRERIFKKS
jgi:putative restriction endonuclease